MSEVTAAKACKLTKQSSLCHGSSSCVFQGPHASGGVQCILLLAQVTEPDFHKSAGRRQALFPLALAAMEAALRRLAYAPDTTDWRIFVYVGAQQACSQPPIHELFAQSIGLRPRSCVPGISCSAVTARGPLNH